MTDYTTAEIIEELERQVRGYDAKPGEPEPARDIMIVAAERLRQYRDEAQLRARMVNETIMMSRQPPGFRG